MDYQNPKIPEGINVTDEHPLKGFLYLLAAVAGTIAIIVLVISLSIGELAKLVPFETEVSLAEKIKANVSDDAIENLNASEQARHQQVQAYLQNLADKLSRAHQLPEEIKITVHYLDEPVINAFATLGGHIFIYQGLIDVLDSENALAMVVAHEIAHVKYRHPIVALSRGASIGLILSMLTGVGDGGSIASQMSLLTSLAFSRSQETESDIDAYNALISYYGHAQGATDLFNVLKKSNHILSPPELLSSHPLSEKRIEKLNELDKGAYAHCSKNSMGCQLTPLPDFLGVN